MSEELNGTLSLLGTREACEMAAAWIADVGGEDRIARCLIAIPDEFIAVDGTFAGPSDWLAHNWGCRGFSLDPEGWWEWRSASALEEPWTQSYNLTSFGATPKPVIVALSRQLPDVEVRYALERWDTGDYEIIVVKGEVIREEERRPHIVTPAMLLALPSAPHGLAMANGATSQTPLDTSEPERGEVEAAAHRIDIEHPGLIDGLSACLYLDDLISLRRGDNKGEYGIEARAIAGRLAMHDRVPPLDDTQDIVHGEFVRYFGQELAGDRDRYRVVAVTIRNRYQSIMGAQNYGD
jgi:hypothetical protein